MMVVAYKADASIVCIDCAEKLYGPEHLGRTDREGNEVFPIFSIDVMESTTCDRCGKGLPE